MMNQKRVSLITVGIIITAIMIIAVYRYWESPKVQIKIDDNLLVVAHRFDDHYYTVVWETDAGSLYSAEKTTDYKAATENQYYLYAGLDERIYWDPQDADGFKYRTATIQITVYPYEHDSPYTMSESKVYTDTITVSNNGEKIALAEERRFGNPIRDTADNDWQQILVLNRQEDYITLRYRCGQEILESETVIWTSNVRSLCEALFQGAPIYVPGVLINGSYMTNDSTTVCLDLSKFNHYYYDDTEREVHPASIKVSAAVTSKRNPDETAKENEAQTHIAYFYGEQNKYYTIE